MSKYTTEVRYICESLAGEVVSVSGSHIESVVNGSVNKIFDFSYPIFSEDYREKLNKKIVYHFYTREIGLETYGLWKHKLFVKMNEIMPLYNQYYESAMLEFNPFNDVNLVKEVVGSGTDVIVGSGTHSNSIGVTVNGTTNNTTTKSDKELYSDTPQGAVSDLESGRYLTNATLNNGSDVLVGSERTDSSTADSGNVSSTENRTKSDNVREVLTGKNGGVDYSTLLMKFRDSFVNIDMMIIAELEELFMQLW